MLSCVVKTMAAVISALGIASTSLAQDDPYPTRLVSIEDLKVESGRMKLALPRRTTQLSTSSRTVVVMAHVKKNGTIARSKVERSSGVGQIDLEVMRSMLNVRFAPFLVDGEPTEVSLVLPVHVPADDVRR